MTLEQTLGWTGLGMVGGTILYEMQPMGPSSPWVGFIFMLGLACLSISNLLRSMK
jgi:hypothetical protein